MNKQRLAVTLLCLAAAVPGRAQTTAKEAEQPYDRELSIYYATPHDSHRAIDWMAGKWKAATKVWGFGSPPPMHMITTTMDNRWLHDGRFLYGVMQRIDTVEAAELATKKPFYHGDNYFGYDNKLRTYWSLVLGNDHTTYLRAEGTLSTDGKRLEFRGPELSPVSGDIFTRIEIFTLKNADEIDYQLRYGFPDGSEITAAEGTFKRES